MKRQVYDKTIVSCDHYQQDVGLFKRLKIYLRKGRFYYDEKKQCWCERYVVHGFIFHGWWYPIWFSPISYKIFWPYGQDVWDDPPSGYEYLKKK